MHTLTTSRLLLAMFCLLILIFFGLGLNWLVPMEFYQPDWVFALIFGALLAQWRHAWWVFPIAFLHDIVLYWTLWPSFLLWLFVPLSLIWMDSEAGPALPQRVFVLLLAGGGLLWQGWSMESTLLTLLLTVCCWYQWVRIGQQLGVSQTLAL